MTETVRLPSAELPTGTVFAKRYQIIEELGTGGMGRVYRVADKTLGEEIALKLIRPEIAAERETLERFKTELKLAREVVHKNVARMFDFNEEDRVPYITMEYVRGENLKRLLRKVGRLFAGQAIPIACQICEGLAEAHRLGIVHRDLKPQNIMIDEDGQAKIMDFGVAQLLKAEERSDGGGTPGTPAYISPEQVKGLPPDERSDLYSLGVLLYEMLTGTLPFKADSARELFHKHQSDVPRDPREVNPGISAELSRVVMKCLEKDPGARFQTAAEVHEALDCLKKPIAPRSPGPKPPTAWLKWAASAGLVAALGLGAYFLLLRPDHFPLKNSIAVLRVKDLSPQAGKVDFSQALQRNISTKLTGTTDLTVIPSLTVDSVAIAGKSSKEIGKALNADYLLQLSIRLEEASLNVKAELIDVRRDRVVKHYDLTRDFLALFSLEDEIARDIARALGVDLAEDRLQRFKRRETTNLDAWLLYHDGHRLIEEVYSGDRREEAFEEAVGNYRRALALDPDFALAYWALGNAYEARYNNTPPGKKNPDDLKKMCEYYYQAYGKNSAAAETNIGLCWYYFNSGEFPKALDFLKNALDLEPRNALVNLDAGAFLRSIGVYRKAMFYLARAAKLDPADPEPNRQISQCQMNLGRFDQAADAAEKALLKNPEDLESRYWYALQLILAGRRGEAEVEVAAIGDRDPNGQRFRVTQAILAAAKGEKEKALALKEDMEILALHGTCFYLFLDMKDEAVANIEAGIERGFETNRDYLYAYPALARNPCFKSLRGLPRFQDILKKQKERYLRDLRKFEKM